MQNMPQIVRQRLRQGIPAVNHPDADVLTAFSERLLPDLERDIVVAHLAACGDCREIVALALPAQEEAQVVIAPSRGWLRWPAVRWGFVAAGVAAIVALGVVRTRHQESRMVAYKAAEPETVTADLQAPAATPSAQAPAESQKKIIATNESAFMATEKKAQRADATPARGTAGTDAFAASLRREPTMPMQLQQQKSATVAQQPAAPPPFAKQAAGEIASNEATKLELGGAGVRVGRAKPASAIGGPVSTVDLAKSAPLQATVAVAADAVPTALVQWTINASGTLQRSFDRGKTWQDVDVNASSAAKESASFEIATKNAPAKDSKMDKMVAQKASMIFRAVATAGTEVWAGGSGSALYHSVDGGSRWGRVLPSSAGSVLSGDIVGIDVVEVSHCRVVTSTSEIWMTGDGGVSWEKQ